jgi:hypothetical protein
MMPRNSPEILRRVWVALHSLIAHRREMLLQCKASFGQHTHRAERNGKEADASAEQGSIAFTEMFTRTIMNRTASIR